MRQEREKSNFVRHEPCPACGSKDNLGRYEDDSAFCFGCGHYINGRGGGSVSDMASRIHKQRVERQEQTKSPVLPDDFSIRIRADALSWLRKFELTDEEIVQHRIGWSDDYESLVFPIYDLSGNLHMCQRRYFGAENFPRFHTRGKAEDIFHIIGRPASSVVTVCEDLISAIKISRVTTVMPLWGANLNKQRMARLSRMFDSLWIWLDKDKEKESLKFRLKGQAMFKTEVRSFITDKDPKCYTTEQIERILYAG